MKFKNKKDLKISFIANRMNANKNDQDIPKPISKTLPSWYKKAEMFVTNPETKCPWIDPNTGNKFPSWKACPSILDVMTSGYALVTPCDIEFFYSNDRISCKVLDKNYLNFIGTRSPMHDFYTPMGYDENHFHWHVDWGIRVPSGYSVIHMHPLNRFELPFISTNGIVDDDKVHIGGQIPFFLYRGWTGVLPAGTPYIQLFPFKRENWISETIIEDDKTILFNNYENARKYRVGDGGVYKNSVWERRYYK